MTNSDKSTPVEALEAFTVFAWTAVTADCEEAHKNLNDMIRNARAALPAAQEQEKFMDDLRLYGCAFAKVSPDGSMERLEPEKVTIARAEGKPK